MTDRNRKKKRMLCKCDKYKVKKKNDDFILYVYERKPDMTAISESRRYKKKKHPVAGTAIPGDNTWTKN